MADSSHDGGQSKPPQIKVEDDPRQDAFGRLTVQSFEDLIGEQEEAVHRDHRVPRRAIRGILAVVNEAVGGATLREYRALCRDVLGRVSKGRRVPRWDAFHADTVARDIRESALIRLAFHLDRFGPSADGFAKLVEDNLRTGKGEHEH